MLVGFSFAESATLYVDNTHGCPGAGTTGDPYCSITEAFNNVVAGDTIAIRSGVYDGFFYTSGKDGTPLLPIIVMPDTGASVVLRNCNAATGEAAIQVKNSNYWIFQDLVFDGSGCGTVPSLYALKVQGDSKDVYGIQVLNNTFRNWRQTSGQDWGPNVLNLAGCQTAFGCGANYYMINSVVRGNVFENVDLIAMKITSTTGMTIEQNDISAVRCGRQGSGGPADTIGMHLTYANTGMVIRDNRIHDFASYLDCPLTSQGFATAVGIWCDENGGMDSNNVIEGNVIYGIDPGKADFSNPNGTDHSATGIFIELGCAGHLISNNVIYDVGSRCLRQSYHATDATTHAANEYYHNTCYDALQGIYLLEGVAIIKDNIVAKCRGVCIEDDSTTLNVLTIDYNLYWDDGPQTKIGQVSPGSATNFATWQTNCGCDANSKNEDPLFQVLP